ncbi:MULTISPECIES: hypothetical protein [Streptomyces]|uniref:Uncharacterized protein n=1 Tax=Streptomyces odorifer TaxID=53450 RepID=A0A7Y6CC11_9ACTN|nr:hypothetical protein [Streptomyces odorifer]NUV30859.1 hypothetical protein [Streptomyces odorifer]NUV32871.1 hypothetical protein [Streptomyces sp. KAI-27]NUV45748.1 hypothetical protein [Streptomyces sp. CAI-78]
MSNTFLKLSVALSLLGSRTVRRAGAAHRHLSDRTGRDRGASSLEWVIITIAVLAGTAVIVVAIASLYGKGAGKVNDVEF